MSDRKIGIIGAGRLGTALARSLSKVGYDVSITNSRDTTSLSLQVKILMPNVKPRNTSDLVSWADVIILAVPLPRFRQLPLEGMRRKIVIDAMNYWAPVDGKLPEFDAFAGSSSELVAQTIPTTRLVKTFNSVAYSELEEPNLPKGDLKRRAIPLAGNDDSAKLVAAELIDTIGFDPVDLGNLVQGRLFQPGTKLFDQRLSKKQILADR